MTRRREVTAEELALWRQAMRETTPLPAREPLAATDHQSPPAPAEGRKKPPSAAGVKPPPQRKAAPEGPQAPGGLDAASQRRLRRGRIEIEGRVDLHGLRRQEAHAVLNRFIAESQAAGRRCVLVITGKGGRAAEGDFVQRDEEGVLRREAPLWLQQPPNAARIFAVEQAHPRHGGAGAFYVFLRKAHKGR